MAIREKKLDDPSGEAPGGSSKDPKKDVLQRFLRALEEYRDTSYRAWRYEDAAYRLSQVLQTIAIEEKAPPDYPSYMEQQARISRKLEDNWLPPEFFETVRRAFTDYIAALKGAWADVDPATISPAELADIAQLMGSAAALLAVPIHRPKHT